MLSKAKNHRNYITQALLSHKLQRKNTVDNEVKYAGSDDEV